MIDTITGWFEVVRYVDKRAITISTLVESTWLSRYPRPIEITYRDNTRKNGHRVDYDYKVGDNFMINKHTA